VNPTGSLQNCNAARANRAPQARNWEVHRQLVISAASARRRSSTFAVRAHAGGSRRTSSMRTRPAARSFFSCATDLVRLPQRLQPLTGRPSGGPSPTTLARHPRILTSRRAAWQASEGPCARSYAIRGTHTASRRRRQTAYSKKRPPRPLAGHSFAASRTLQRRLRPWPVHRRGGRAGARRQSRGAAHAGGGTTFVVAIPLGPGS
jgi:hypothetical protein